MMEEKVKDVISYIHEKEKELEVQVEKEKINIENTFNKKIEEFLLKQEEKRQEYLREIKDIEKIKKEEIERKIAEIAKEYDLELKQHKEKLEGNLPKALDFLFQKLLEG
jgi:hypothetical protein